MSRAGPRPAGATTGPDGPNGQSGPNGKPGPAPSGADPPAPTVGTAQADASLIQAAAGPGQALAGPADPGAGEAVPATIPRVRSGRALAVATAALVAAVAV